MHPVHLVNLANLHLTLVRVRGEPHLLLVGDPGTAKSQLLRYSAQISPRWLPTTTVTVTTVTTNLFQNAKILEKKIAQPPHAGFHPILSQDPKDF